MTKEKGTTIYVSDEAIKSLKSVEVKVGPREAIKNSDKIIDLVYFYEKYKDKI